MMFSIHSLWGSYITITDYKFDGTCFSGNLHFTLYDHFGLDQPDVEKMYVYLAGFRSGLVKKCAVIKYPKSWIGRYQAA